MAHESIDATRSTAPVNISGAMSDQLNKVVFTSDRKGLGETFDQCDQSWLFTSNCGKGNWTKNQNSPIIFRWVCPAWKNFVGLLGRKF